MGQFSDRVGVMEDGTHSTLFGLPKTQVNQSLRTFHHSGKKKFKTHQNG